MSQRDDLVSVVVIGRNEGDRLRRCLASVNAMNKSGFDTEVIYVDSGSTDNSLDIAGELGATVIALKPERPTAALGRNAGWRAAQGFTVLFLDGDTILDANFVAQSLPELWTETHAVIWGHRREIYPEQSLYNRVLDLDWIYAPGLTQFCGGDALMRHEALAEVDGYDETLIAGEEPDMCRRMAALGYTILHVDRPMTGHDLSMTKWSQYWKRATRAGHAYAEISQRMAAIGQTFWADEVERNRRRAPLLMGAALWAVLATIVFRSWWPLAATFVFYAALVLRSAYKARWKSRNVVTLLLYGIHSHFQQIPIYFGQRSYQRNQKKGQQAKLVEYK
jgi:glycosyltransferase involved in cell wall biosynthesis